MEQSHTLGSNNFLNSLKFISSYTNVSMGKVRIMKLDTQVCKYLKKIKVIGLNGVKKINVKILSSKINCPTSYKRELNRELYAVR